MNSSFYHEGLFNHRVLMKKTVEKRNIQSELNDYIDQEENKSYP